MFLFLLGRSFGFIGGYSAAICALIAIFCVQKFFVKNSAGRA